MGLLTNQRAPQVDIKMMSTRHGRHRGAEPKLTNLPVVSMMKSIQFSASGQSVCFIINNPQFAEVCVCAGNTIYLQELKGRTKTMQNKINYIV